MNLYLLRHGEAEPRSRDDPARELTPRGRQDVEKVARRFAARHLRLDNCYVSPYIRAAQTAELFLSCADQTLQAETTPVLMPEVRAVAVMTFLEGLRAEHVMLVSHNPLLSELNALLTEGDISHMRILGTSELVCITLDRVGLGMGTSSFSLLPGMDARRA